MASCDSRDATFASMALAATAAMTRAVVVRSAGVKPHHYRRGVFLISQEREKVREREKGGSSGIAKRACACFPEKKSEEEGEKGVEETKKRARARRGDVVIFSTRGKSRKKGGWRWRGCGYKYLYKVLYGSFSFFMQFFTDKII